MENRTGRGRGFQRVGSLVPKISPLSPGSASTPEPSPTSSAISGTAFREQGGSKAIGMPPTAIPAAGQPSARALAIVATASEGSLQHDPARLLTPSMRSSLETTWNDAGDEYGWNGRVIRYELNQPRSAGELAEAIDIAEASLLPMSKREVLAELARVRAMTVSRDISMDLQLVLAAYADELIKYPGDAVREVLRGWARDEKFWPSMSELIARLNRLVAPRHALLDGLRRGYRGPPEVSPAGVAPKPVTDEERAEVEAMLAKNGFVTDATGRGSPELSAMRARAEPPATSAARAAVASAFMVSTSRRR